MADEERSKAEHPQEVYLRWIAEDMKMVRSMLSKVINYMVEAESEVSEKMRRFMMYMHDVHDVTYLYEERGQAIPEWILRELERCDDRYRQLLEEAHKDGGTFEKVRRDMASDPLNRWDHTRQLGKPKETTDDQARTSDDLGSARPEGGTEPEGGEPGSGELSREQNG